MKFMLSEGIKHIISLHKMRSISMITFLSYHLLYRGPFILDGIGIKYLTQEVLILRLIYFTLQAINHNSLVRNMNIIKELLSSKSLELTSIIRLEVASYKCYFIRHTKTINNYIYLFSA